MTAVTTAVTSPAVAVTTAVVATLLAAAVAFDPPPARAGDLVGRGGVIRDHRAVTPVPFGRPAPSPVRDWYVRADVGYHFWSHGDVVAENGARAFGIEDTSAGVFGGLGFGRYLTPSLRADLTFDVKSRQRLAPDRSDAVVRDTAALGYPATFDVATAEDTFVTSYIGLANIYYDLERRGPFRPYVGAGLGAGFQRLKRDYAQVAACRTADSDSDPVTADVSCAGTSFAAGSSGTSTTIGVAAALMAGFALDLAPGLKLDTSYRLAWQATGVTLTGPNALGGVNRLGLDDRIDHEIRTGLRLDLTP